MKKYITLCLILIASFFFAHGVRAAEVFFEYTAARYVSRGVEYERILQMTSLGLRDIHILRVPMDAPYIHVAPVSSELGVGRRQTPSALLSAAGAVAGVNADFFDMTANYAMHLGITVQDGEVLSANTRTNHDRDAFATFWVDNENNPFFQHLRVAVHVYINGVRALQISQMNNIGNQLTEAIVFTRAAMECTTALDERFPDTTKVVSDGYQITWVSQPGEMVIIPEDGFIIVFPPRRVPDLNRFSVGYTAQLSVTNHLNINFAQMQSAVGGAGLLLADGELTLTDGYIIWGRHPRTAVGATYSGCTLILMVVDGRVASVGATHTELSELMLRAGAHNAMHLDGGASSVMVVQENNRHTVVNTPAGGPQRAVVNALGVFDTATPGEMTGLALEVPQRRVAVGTPVPVTVMAQDVLGLRFPIAEGALFQFWNADREAGFWQDNIFTPLEAGEHPLMVWYGFYVGGTTIYAVELAELHAAPVSVQIGTRTRLLFSGTAVDGMEVSDISVLDLAVVPETLGRVENGNFIASDAGAGYIRARVGRVVAYIPVSVGEVSPPLTMLLSVPSFAGYPPHVEGTATLASLDTHLAARLNYQVTPSAQTQAAHLVFYPPLNVPVSPYAAPTHLRMQVFSDGSGHWLRGRVTDANGMAHTINFTQNADFIGWDVVTAQLPANMAFPITLDRLWMAVLESDVYSAHSLYFYNIQTLYAPAPLPEVPAGTRFRDPLMTHSEFTGHPGGFNTTRTEPTSAGTYWFSLYGNTAVVRLSANAGGLDDIRQWQRLANDVHTHGPRHILIRINRDPHSFPSHVFELFHAMMRSFAAEGRTVLVASPGGPEAAVTIHDGVRYIRTARISVFTHGEYLWWYGG